MLKIWGFLVELTVRESQKTISPFQIPSTTLWTTRWLRNLLAWAIVAISIAFNPRNWEYLWVAQVSSCRCVPCDVPDDLVSVILLSPKRRWNEEELCKRGVVSVSIWLASRLKDARPEPPASDSMIFAEPRRGVGSSSNRNSIVSRWFRWHRNCQATNSQAAPRLSLSPQSSSVAAVKSHFRILDLLTSLVPASSL